MNAVDLSKILAPSVIESMIVAQTIAALVDEGYRLEISNQDGGAPALFVYAWDTEERPVPVKHWVMLVPGNGPDVISDYSVNLEEVLKDVNAFAAACSG